MLDYKNNTYKEIEIDCTKYMQNLFGDGVVSSAVTSVRVWNTVEENAIKDALEKSLKTSSIDFDATGDLEVTFVNGKTLTFWVSEWGGIDTKKVDSYEE